MSIYSNKIDPETTWDEEEAVKLMNAEIAALKDEIAVLKENIRILQKQFGNVI